MNSADLEIFKDKTEINPNYLISFPYDNRDFLVNGEIRKWDGGFQKVYSPIFYKTSNDYENLIGSYPLLDETISLEALSSAEIAYNNGNGEWSASSVSKRIEAVKKFTHLMKERREIIVKLLMWEIGKSLKDSEKEFDRTIDYINDTIEALKTLDRDSSRFTLSQGIYAQIRRAPMGIVLCMGPFNYPLNETFTTLIPALIMGNTVILKPPKLGVLLFSPLLEAFRDSFPKGVVNILFGEGETIVTPLMKSGKINVLAFIGSSRVADILKKHHPAPHRLRSVLGLDAKNPAIILPDADLDLAVSECISGALSFNGQRCTAIKIIYVHESIAEEFNIRLSKKMEDLTIGLPWDENVNITPLPEAGKIKYLKELIDDAISLGGKVFNPSGGLNYKSLFFPTLITGVKPEMRVYHEEQFGPIVPIVTYSKLEEPLQYVVQSNYGQQASVFGKDTDKIAKLVDILVNQVCRVNINSQCQRGPDVFPFTGRKDSAEGTLSVTDALRVFSIRTLVAVKENELNKQIVSEIIRENKSTFLSTDFIF